MKAEEMIGKKYGMLLVFGIDHITENFQVYLKCKCDCGNEKAVRYSHIKDGKVISCGCYRRKNLKKYQSNRTTHGKTNTRLYTIWHDMKSRCNNEKSINYKNYGGKGVKVCQQWENSFIEFYKWAINNGYSESLTIDRIDSNGNYDPYNCRWVDIYTQNKNRKGTVHINYYGEDLIVSELARKLNIEHSTLLRWVKSGKYDIDTIIKRSRKKNENTGIFF